MTLHNDIEASFSLFLDQGGKQTKKKKKWKIQIFQSCWMMYEGMSVCVWVSMDRVDVCDEVN